jgi:TolB protein
MRALVILLAVAFLAGGAQRPWLVYVRATPLPDTYSCASLPRTLDRLMVEPGGSLPAPAAIVNDPAWSPDGGRIAFSSGAATCTNGDGVGQTTAHIWTMDATGRGLRALTHGETLDRWPAWSADGRRLAFVRFDIPRGTGGIYVVGVDGRGAKRISAAKGLHLAWSPDGNTLAFVPGELITFGESDANRVVLIDLVFRSVRRIPFPEPSALAWSPDGTRLAVGGASAVSILDRSGRLVRRIAVVGRRATAYVDGVTWSPDGRRLAYSYGGTVVVVGADGRHAREVVRGSAPHWRS